MVNNSTNNEQNELQPSLNSDGQQFYQYQQNELQPPLNSDEIKRFTYFYTPFQSPWRPE